MHESFSSYIECTTRRRNGGLFVADRNLGGSTARFTRQNNYGNRHGFECPEERDYYPYWAASPWVDIAVLTDERSVAQYCTFFKNESQNVKPRYYCKDPSTGNPSSEIEESSCTLAGKEWTKVNSWGISPPDCRSIPYSKDNSLDFSSYSWTLPRLEEVPCWKSNQNLTAVDMVLRIRYNISSTDIIGYGSYGSNFTDYTFNRSPLISTDPNVVYSGNILSLAVDGSQNGRTFQDRTHVFKLKKRPENVQKTERIYNLNVRGKRGNFVETFPATIYDFVPNTLSATIGDYIHIQWQGTTKNPQGNSGEGTPGTDKYNMVQMEDIGSIYPASDEWIEKNPHKTLFESPQIRYLLAFSGQDLNSPSQCLNITQLQLKNNYNINAIQRDQQNCYKLNAAPSYLDAGLFQLNKTGTYYYMCSRNNEFSTRTQKGTIIVNSKDDCNLFL
jgi:hypothetical protein